MSWFTDIVMPIPSMIAGWLGGFTDNDSGGTIVNEGGQVIQLPDDNAFSVAEKAVPWVVLGVVAYMLIKSK